MGNEPQTSPSAMSTNTFNPSSAWMADDAQQQPSLAHPCQPLIKLLSGGSFYFSFSFDLTHRMQDRISRWSAQQQQQQTESSSPDLSSVASGVSILDGMDMDFVWNRHLLRHLFQMRDQELTPTERSEFDRGSHLVALIQGFVGSATVTAPNSVPYQLSIISRLSANRAGTRYNARGINDDGHVSNFVETEFLVYCKSGPMYASSFTQIRGSVPVFWEQTGVQVPVKIVFSRGPESSVPAATRHFEDLVCRYSTIQIVNLLGQSPGSGEYSLSESYRHVVGSMSPDISSSLSYTNFDFHAIVKHDQYDRLDDLFDQIRPIFESFGYFMMDTQSMTPVFQQSGVIRTNCLDCLDRTNVVQTFFARRQLDAYLSRMNVRLAGSFQQDTWISAFNGLWADNGDWLSRIYAGTGALKSSYTRHGKQTVFGYLDDATKSVSRFYVSNFQDKSRQEAIDMLFRDLNGSGAESLLMRHPVYDMVDQQMEARRHEYARSTDHTIFVGTFNLNGQLLRSGDTLESWIKWPPSHAPSLIVIGVQELIELTPGQYITADTNTLRLVWESIFLKSIQSRARNTSSYVVLRSVHLVALGLFAFVREDVVNSVRHVETSVIKTGLGGMAANKGGIGLSLHLHDTSIAFVTAHFAAGTSAVDERNRDYFTITTGLRFKRVPKLYDHDIVIWHGDFNYRIDFGNEDVRMRVVSGRQDKLVEMAHRYDQMIVQMRAGKVFDGFIEGPLTFDPTYKYDNGTKTYDSSEKNRTPSWTDRVLYKSRHHGINNQQADDQSIRLIEYGRGEDVLMSDHRPIRAIFSVRVDDIDFRTKQRIYGDLVRKAFETAMNGNQGGGLKLGAVAWAAVATTSASNASGNAVHRAPPLPPRNPSPKPALPPQKPNPSGVVTGTLIDLSDDAPSTSTPLTLVQPVQQTMTQPTPSMSPINSTNPFLPSDPAVWMTPSGPLPPPSSSTYKWWQPVPPVASIQPNINSSVMYAGVSSGSAFSDLGSMSTANHGNASNIGYALQDVWGNTQTGSPQTGTNGYQPRRPSLMD